MIEFPIIDKNCLAWLNLIFCCNSIKHLFLLRQSHQKLFMEIVQVFNLSLKFEFLSESLEKEGSRHNMPIYIKPQGTNLANVWSSNKGKQGLFWWQLLSKSNKKITGSGNCLMFELKFYLIGLLGSRAISQKSLEFSFKITLNATKISNRNVNYYYYFLKKILRIFCFEAHFIPS